MYERRSAEITRKALENAGYKFIDDLGLVRLPKGENAPKNLWERKALKFLGFTPEVDI